MCVIYIYIYTYVYIYVYIYAGAAICQVFLDTTSMHQLIDLHFFEKRPGYATQAADPCTQVQVACSS